MTKRAILGLCVASALVAGAEFPRAKISNGLVTAKFYLPDAEHGYYKATRFDWGGVIYSLRAFDHEYFGQFYPSYDPKRADTTGPVEEFRTGNAGLGYKEASVGGTFIKIGVGVLRKPDESAFQSSRLYEIVDAGKHSARSGKDWIEFVHKLHDDSGYAYHYTKTFRLVKGKAEFVLEHSLKNTGRKTINTGTYSHNFFYIDGKPSGPDTVVKFPFDLIDPDDQMRPVGNRRCSRAAPVEPHLIVALPVRRCQFHRTRLRADW